MSILKHLNKRADKLERKINRRHKWAQRTRKLQKQLGKKIGKRLNGLLKAIKKQNHALHKDLREVNAKIEKQKEKNDGSRKRYLQFLEDSVGKVEGSDWQRKVAAYIGVPWEWAWCSTLTGYGLAKYGGFKKSELPSQTPYSGSWLTWSGGNRVSYSQVQPGDLLIFDWGDGGMTDHVATYVGNGLKIGGNENDRVEKDAVPVSDLVGVVRPKWDR